MDYIIPHLNVAEQRVLGSLMEKSRTTPDYYPMTINSLTAACNQKTSRFPIVQFNEEYVVQTIDSLKKKGLVSTATGGSSRVVKYKHNFAIVYQLVPSELAIISLLLLRGAQTPGELNTNSGRLYEFETIEEVHDVLQKLSDSDKPFIKSISKRPGQKEARYIHLLGDQDDVTDGFIEKSGANNTLQLEERVAKLEDQLQALREEFDKLMKELS